MKVRILVEFDIEGVDDENVAKSAASMAAYDCLALTDQLGSVDSASVFVDGHGEVTVRLGEDHE